MAHENEAEKPSIDRLIDRMPEYLTHAQVEDALAFITALPENEGDGSCPITEHHARTLASELLRLRASAPKVWDAGSIGDAPEGAYWLRTNGHDGAQKHWTQTPKLTGEIRRKISFERFFDAAFGPIPQPKD